MIIEQRLEEVYGVIKQHLRYQATTPLLLALTTTFSLRDEGFEVARYEALKEEIKKQTGAFSYLRSNISMVLPNLMPATDAQEAVAQLLANYELLIEQKFPRSNFSYLAANYIQDEAHAKRAMSYYTALRTHHMFLTTHDDVPYAVLLTVKEEQDPLQLADTVHQYIKDLTARGYYKSNELLWLAQLLAMDDANYQSTRVEEVVAMEQKLVQYGIKKKAQHYVIIGLLTLLNYNDTQLTHIIGLSDTLAKMKQFKWYKQYALYSAIQITVHITKGETDGMLEASILTAIETAIQAQQMTVAVTLMNTNSAT